MTGIGGGDILLGLMGGLGLFLFGVSRISASLAEVATERVRLWLERGTRNALLGLLVGTVATVVLNSSSVVIILVVAMVHAGLLRFEHSLGVILGANIGTTLSSQLFALDVDQFAPVALLAGLVMHVVWKQGRVHQAGRLLLDLGLLFFGLSLMGAATAPLQGSEWFLGWLEGMERPAHGALAGALFTAIIQSSSATLGIIIKMAANGVMTLPAGIGIMMGAEIGTCADTLIATLGRSRAALRAGLFHLVFNLISVAAGLLLFAPFLSLIAMIPGSTAHQIANAHVLFNVLGAAAGIWLVRPMAALLHAVIPDASLAPAPTRQQEAEFGRRLPVP